MNTFDRQRAQRDLPPRENSTPVDRKPVRLEKKRIYVELRSSDEEVQMFLALCAERQMKFIIHLRPALDDRR